MTKTKVIRAEAAATESGSTCSGNCAHAQGEDTTAEAAASSGGSRQEGQSWEGWTPLVSDDDFVDLSAKESTDTVAAAGESPWSTGEGADADTAEADSP